MCAQTLFCRPRVSVVVSFLWFSLFVERRLKCERQRKERERGEKTEARSVSEAWKRRSPKHFNHFQKRKKKTYQFYILNDQNKGTSSPTGKDCTVVGCVCMYVCVCVSLFCQSPLPKKKTLRVKKAEARHQRRCTFSYTHLQFKLDLRKRENSLIEKKVKIL